MNRNTHTQLPSPSCSFPFSIRRVSGIALLFLALLFLAAVNGWTAPLPEKPAVLDATVVPAPQTHNGLMRTAADGDTSWYGGTFWDPVDLRWEAQAGEKWTFDQGVAGDLDGWVGWDRSRSQGIFRRISKLDPGWEGFVCVGDNPDSPVDLGGNYSWWVGLLPGEARDAGFASQFGAGYGNKWDTSLSRTFQAAPFQAYTISYSYWACSEWDYDFTRVYVNGVLKREYHGCGPDAAGTEYISVFTDATGIIQVDFRFTSDTGYSDEDGLWNADCGAFGLDDFSILGTLFNYTTDFETDEPGWVATRFEGYGDFSHLEDIQSVQAREGLVNPCECSLKGNALVFHDEGGHPLGQNNFAYSPWVELAPGDQNRSGKVLQFNILPNARLANYLLYSFYVQFENSDESLSGWTNLNFVYYNPATTCITQAYDISRIVPCGTSRLRVALGVVDLRPDYGLSNPVPSTPAFDNVRVGVYGEVSAGSCAPLFSVSSLNTYPQDSFPADGTLNLTSPGRIDCNDFQGAGPDPYSSIGDTLVVWTAGDWVHTRVVFAVDPGPAFVPGSPRAQALADWLTGHQYEGSAWGLDWYSARMDTAEWITSCCPIEGRWMTAYHESDPNFRTTGGIFDDKALDPNDLNPWGGQSRLLNDIFPDDLLCPGSRLLLFYKAGSTDEFDTPPSSTGWTTLPADTSGMNVLEMEVLPSSMRSDGTFNQVLYINGYVPNDGFRQAIEAGLAQALPASSENFDSSAWDRWDIRGVSSQQSTLSRPTGTTYGATLQQLQGYQVILWDAGILGFFPMRGGDRDQIIDWLTDSEERGLYLAGNSWASYAVGADADFLASYLGAQIVCPSARSEGCPPGSERDIRKCLPLKAPASPPHVPASAPAVLRGNFCPQLLNFDVLDLDPLALDAGGSPRINRLYDKKGAASIGNVNATSSYKTVLDGFSPAYLRDPDCEGEGALGAWLTDILDWLLVVGDRDNDLIPDNTDACPDVAPGLGEVDRNGDGCPETTSSFRFVKFFAPDQFPVYYETDATGDPRITDGSEFSVLANAFATWANVAGVTISGGDDGTRAGPSIVSTSDRRNTISFSDPKGYLPGVLAITPTTTVDRETEINGRTYRPGEIVEFEMLFNSSQFTFSTPTHPGPAGSYDLLALAVHEFGHAFGFSHTFAPEATMFYVVPPGPEAASLEADDLALTRRGYATTPPQLTVEGRVLRPDGQTPVPGAAVFARSASTGTILQFTPTGADGTYRLYEIPEDFVIYIHPLDGTGVTNGLTAAAVNAEMAAIADLDFLPETYDGAGETSSDFDLTGSRLSPSDAPIQNADILVNADQVAPDVVASTPGNGAVGVPAMTAIAVKFDERIDIDYFYNNPDVRLTNLNTATGVAGSAALLQDDSLVVFTPLAPLAYSTPYEFRLGPNVRDISGNFMAGPVILGFETEVQPPVSLISLSPAEAPVGAALVIYGEGFDPNPEANLIRFSGGIDVYPDAATPDRLILGVPAGVETGDVTVQVGPLVSEALSLTILPPKQPPSGNALGAAALAGVPKKVAVVPGGIRVFVAHGQGVSVVGAQPVSPDFLQVTEIPVGGGCTGVVSLPAGDRLVVVGATNPRLRMYDIDPSSPTYLAIVAEANLSEIPLGLALVPGGGEVIVSHSGRIVLHSARPTEFGQELKSWSSPDFDFVGDIGVSADGEEAYAAASGGTIAILGLLPGEGIVARVSGGASPRELAGSPDGRSFFSVDEEGILRRFGKRGSRIEDPIAVGGGSRGITVSPEGSFAYGANYILNRIDAFDLQQSRTNLAGSFATGVDPVDIATGSAGRYIYVATAGQSRLEVYDTQSGASVTGVAPPSGGPGTYITVSGSGFDAIPANNSVSIGGVTHVPLRVDPDGTSLVVVQDPSVTRGPLTVTSAGRTSNAATYRPVHRQTPGSFAAAGSFAAGGISARALAATPGGKLLIAGHQDGSLVALNADPKGGGLHRILATLGPGETGLSGISEMVLTPRGDKLYVEDPVLQRIAVFSVDPLSPTPLTAEGFVSGLPSSPFSLAASLDDEGRIYVASFLTGEIHVIDAALGQVTGTYTGFVSPEGLAVHPEGHVLLVADRSGADPGLPATVRAIDIVPGSAAFGTVVGSVPLGSAGTRSLVVTPVGDVLALVPDVSGAAAVELLLGGAPVSLTVGRTAAGLGSGDVALVPNRSGTLVHVQDPGGERLQVLDLASMALLGDEVPGLTGLVGGAAGALSVEDARLYVSAGLNLQAVDLTPVIAVEIFSGGNQTGVSGRPLPSPIGVSLSSSAGRALLEGSPVTFTTSGNGSFGSAGPSVTLAADALGLASTGFTPGSLAGPETISVTSAIGSTLATVQVLEDTTLTPPSALRVTPVSAVTGPAGVNTTVSAQFSKAIQPSTVSSTTFKVRTLAGSAVRGSFGLADRQRRVVFVPAAALDYDTDYVIELTSGLTDQVSRPLSNPGSYSFRTGSAPLPVLGAVTAPSAVAGDRVVLTGAGFSRIPDQNEIRFSGATTLALTSDPGTLTAAVPTGAVSGPLQVVADGVATGFLDYLVLEPLPEPISTVVDVTQVPESGQDIAILPDGSRAYVTLPNGNSVLPLRREGAGLVVEESIPVGTYPFGVVCAPDGKRVFVSNYFSNDVAVVDTDPLSPRFHRVIAFIPVGTNPSGLVPNPNDRDLYVLNYGDKTLNIVDIDPTSTNAYSARSTVDTGTSSKSVTVTPDGGRIIVGTATGLLIIQADDTSARQSVDTGSSTKGVTVTPDGGLAVVLTTNNFLLLIDIIPGSPTEGQARASVDTGTSAKGVTVSPDGGFIYVIGELQILVYQIKKTSSPSASGGAQSGSFFQLTLDAEIPVGENPTAAAFDPSDGEELLVVNSGDNTITVIAAETPPQIVEADVDVDPNALNLNSNGQYVMAYLEFPPPVDPAKVDLGSVRLESTVAADTSYSALVDRDFDGILEQSVRFSRSEALAVLPAEDTVRVEITGFVDGLEFTGADSVRILRPRRWHPATGDVLSPGSTTSITWEPVDTTEADRVDIFFSPDGGESWESVAEASGTDTTVAWSVPEVISPRALLVLAARRSHQAGVLADGTMTGVAGYSGLDEPFAISKVTEVEEVLPLRFALRPVSPNPFSAAAQIRFELPEAAKVTVRIYGVDGGLVRAVIEDTPYEPGRYGVAWDGRDTRGRSVGAGVYFVRLEAGPHKALRKIIRLP